MQEQLKPQYQGYLFVHPNLLRIITTNDFNGYLAKLCADNNVVDSDGNAAKINLSLKEECRKLNYEYACVLGDNQKLRENKLIRL